MSERQKIPLLLKLKRAKNSPRAEAFNSLLSHIKPVKRLSHIPRKILLIRNDRIGDAVVTLPVIRDIKLNYPEIQIDIIASSKNKFVFQAGGFADNIIELDWAPEKLPFLYRLPLLGSPLQFTRYVLLPYLFTPSFRKKIKQLKETGYDAVIDLVGLKRNILLGKLTSPFTAGPRLFGAYSLYSYYSRSNWVTAYDDNFMTKKIENVLSDALGLQLSRHAASPPLARGGSPHEKLYDIIIHLGTSPLRKLPPEKEKELIQCFSGRSILVTDSGETENFLSLKNRFSSHAGITFKTFASLEELAAECMRARVLLCYDGGQAHYLSQFVRTVVLFGPGSVELWKPYEFAGYALLEEDINKARAIISQGQYKHIAVYYPLWCRPCFDVGCTARPCLVQLRTEFICGIINKYCLQ